MERFQLGAVDTARSPSRESPLLSSSDDVLTAGSMHGLDVSCLIIYVKEPDESE